MNEIVDLVSEAVRRAGKLLVDCYGRTEILQKGAPHNLVTEADVRAEELVIEFLGRSVPDSSFYGEETNGKARLDAKRLWIIDPLDGTTNYAHGIPHFGVSVAYADEGTLFAGAVYDPMRNELFSASRGGGAYLNGRAITVSKKTRLEECLIATGFYYDRAQYMKKTLGALENLFKRNIRCMRRMGACTLDLTWLACGRFDGYFEFTLSPWDFAAGLLIVNEAGGSSSGRDGAAADLFSQGVLCSNGRIHQEFVREVLAS
ncbi:MAG: inositol monophosphatase [Chitinispirillaceae bacterium]|nr:inositol monophosphatase [Chitinispirillaceae bacterium]